MKIQGVECEKKDAEIIRLWYSGKSKKGLTDFVYKTERMFRKKMTKREAQEIVERILLDHWLDMKEHSQGKEGVE